MAATEKVTDFGEKIGGARKDLWKVRGLMCGDLAGMNAMERKKYVTKAQIWPRPVWAELIADGMPRMVAYWANGVRAALKPAPCLDTEEEQNRYTAFAADLRDSVMAVRSETDIEGFYESFFYGHGYLTKDGPWHAKAAPSAKGIVDNKLLRKAQAKASSLKHSLDCRTFAMPKEEAMRVKLMSMAVVARYGERGTLLTTDCQNNKAVLKVGVPGGTFYVYPKGKMADSSSWHEGSWLGIFTGTGENLLVTWNMETEEAARLVMDSFVDGLLAKAKGKEPKARATKGKTVFQVPHLDVLKRTGPEVLSCRYADEEDYLSVLGFRGGEFGNWVSNKERQKNMDMAYEALADLTDILGVDISEASLGGKLAIAFGARGTGCVGAGAAHYEPLRNVINLTKMSGGGCLAHEWGHALDWYLGEQYAPGSGRAATELATQRPKAVPETVLELVRSLEWKMDGNGYRVPTEYLIGSKKFDILFRKHGHGYWSSGTELFARAFDCYVKDRLTAAGRESQYLTANAGSFLFPDENGGMIYAFPRGEEREQINQCFDRLFGELRESGILQAGRSRIAV